MALLLLHPEVSTRSCEDCCTYEYNHKTGERIERRTGPVKRPTKGPGSLPPCLSGMKCAKGTLGNTCELSHRNWKAYQHYRRCKAIGKFPDDPIVEKNAASIAAIERLAERQRGEFVVASTMATAMAKAMSNG